MKKWSRISIVLVAVMLVALWAHAAGVSRALHNGYEALFYHSIRMDETFPSINPLGISIAEFERAATEDGAAEANLMLGLLYQYLDRPGTALGYLLQFAGAHPEQIWVNSLIGDMYAAMGRGDDARIYYERALADTESGDGFAQAYLGLGHLAYERGEYEAAREAYSRAVEKSSDYVDARLALGKALYQMGELEEAIEVLEIAQLQAPRYAPVYQYLALSYEAAGLMDKAEHAQQRVKELEQ